MGPVLYGYLVKRSSDIGGPRDIVSHRRAAAPVLAGTQQYYNDSVEQQHNTTNYGNSSFNTIMLNEDKHSDWLS